MKLLLYLLVVTLLFTLSKGIKVQSKLDIASLNAIEYFSFVTLNTQDSDETYVVDGEWVTEDEYDAFQSDIESAEEDWDSDELPWDQESTQDIADEYSDEVDADEE